jgi:hypothetical protein
MNRKLTLLAGLISLTMLAGAQITLTGLSPYHQSFDTMTSAGLPTGWETRISATANSLGTVYTFGPGTAFGSYWDTVDCPQDVFGTGFKNSASNDAGGGTATMTCAEQEAVTNRALAVRQSSPTSHPGYDPGASFTFHLSSTRGMSNLAIGFRLEALDSMSPRVTPWTIDYGIGVNPLVFTPITTTTGTLTTGGNSFTNDSITATFGTVLDSIDQDVYIRISTLASSTGSGNRTTTGIDDFTLTWSGTATAVTGIGNLATQTASLKAIGNPSTAGNIELEIGTPENDKYNLNIYDISGRLVYSQIVNGISGKQILNVNLGNAGPGIYLASLRNYQCNVSTKLTILK